MFDHPIPERASVLITLDADGIRISAVLDGVTYSTPVPLVSPDVAREYLGLLCPWLIEPGNVERDDALIEQLAAWRDHAQRGTEGGE